MTVRNLSTRFSSFYMRGPLLLSSSSKHFLSTQPLDDSSLRRRHVAAHRESPLDYFQRKMLRLLSRKNKDIDVEQLQSKDPLKLLELCCEQGSANFMQNLVSSLLVAYIKSKNHTNAFKLYQYPHFHSVFEGKKGSAICLMLMLFMYEEERYINVLSIRQHILKGQINNSDILELVDALYIAALLKTNSQVPCLPVPDYSLSRFYLAVHYLSRNKFQHALEAVQVTRPLKYKNEYFNLLVQIYASTHQLKELSTILQQSAFHRVKLFLDTQNVLHGLCIEGTRGRQLSRQIFWATCCGLLESRTTMESLEKLTKEGVSIIYEAQKDDWDSFGRWIENCKNHRRRSLTHHKTIKDKQMKI